MCVLALMRTEKGMHASAHDVPHDHPCLCRMPASEDLCRWVWPQSAAHQLQPIMNRCQFATLHHALDMSATWPHACSEFTPLQNVLDQKICTDTHM